MDYYYGGEDNEKDYCSCSQFSACGYAGIC